MIRWSSSLGIVATLAASACTTEDEGTVTVTAYGESFVEDGIPASEVGDGWAIDFARFDVEIADVMVAGSVVDIDDLWAWLSAQVRTLGHVDGEGHCRATAVD